MKSFVVPMACVALALALSGCGGKSGGSSTSGAAAGGAAVSPYDQGPRAAETPIDESKVVVGRQLFQTKGCSACHSFGKRMSGPNLSGVTRRRTADWMEHQILHPEIMTHQDPISRQLFAQFALQMPNQGLTPDQARAVIEFFKHTDPEGSDSKHD